MATTIDSPLSGHSLCHHEPSPNNHPNSYQINPIEWLLVPNKSYSPNQQLEQHDDTTVNGGSVDGCEHQIDRQNYIINSVDTCYTNDLRTIERIINGFGWTKRDNARGYKTMKNCRGGNLEDQIVDQKGNTLQSWHKLPNKNRCNHKHKPIRKNKSNHSKPINSQKLKLVNETSNKQSLQINSIDYWPNINCKLSNQNTMCTIASSQLLECQSVDQESMRLYKRTSYQCLDNLGMEGLEGFGELEELEGLERIKSMDDKNAINCPPSQQLSSTPSSPSIRSTPSHKSYSPHNLPPTSHKWSLSQTQAFYRLLGIYGTDFTLMCHHPYFSSRRSKKELLNKYKKEEKCNQGRIESVWKRVMNGETNMFCLGR